jgi:hypothetical protein
MNDAGDSGLTAELPEGCSSCSPAGGVVERFTSRAPSTDPARTGPPHPLACPDGQATTMTRPMSMRLPSSSSSSSSVVVLPLLALAILARLRAADGASFFASDDTTPAPISTENPNVGVACNALQTCVNGCKSDFYRVAAGGPGVIQASTCVSAAFFFSSRIYVWNSSGGGAAACSTFVCNTGA